MARPKKSNGKKQSKKLRRLSPPQPPKKRVRVVDFLRASEVAKALGLRRETVQLYLRMGIIPAKRAEVNGRLGWWKIDPAWVAERQAAGWPYVHQGPQRPGRPRSFPLPGEERSLLLPFPTKSSAGT